MTIENYLNQYHTKQTADSYLRAINHFLFHSKYKEQSGYADIIAYLFEYNYRSPRIISGIKRYFDYLTETGKRDDHPCKGFSIKAPRRDIQFQELFTGEELEILLDRPVRYKILEDRNKAILSLLIYQGLSPENIVNLKTEDIDIDQGTIYIKATKKLKRRELELKPKQVILLYRYINESRSNLNIYGSNKLFIGKRGTEFSVDALNRMIRPLQALYPHKNLNPQTIRQSVITNWLNVQNIPLEDVQLLSGLKWMSSTERYVRPNMDERREVINEFFPI